MLKDVLEAKIEESDPGNAVEQESVLQELMQHYVLVSLAKAGLFKVAMFHGGTCLRILYGMQRFSEDLDFLLKAPDREFGWQVYLNQVREDCALEGINFEIQDKSKADLAVKKAFLKTDSIGQIMTLTLPFSRESLRKIKIKLEIDANPPEGSECETRFLAFPRPAAVTCQTLTSGFATKAHALLCRSYVKGRDWYDLIWYASKKVKPKLDLLSHALDQQGPWAGKAIDVTNRWFLDQLERKIRAVDWPAARDDVSRFLPTREQEGLTHWHDEFFLSILGRIRDTLL